MGLTDHDIDALADAGRRIGVTDFDMACELLLGFASGLATRSGDAAAIGIGITGLVATARRWHADLIHARLWANYCATGEGPPFATHNDADEQARAYAFRPGPWFNEAHLTAGDGWRVGQLVQPLEPE